MHPALLALIVIGGLALLPSAIKVAAWILAFVVVGVLLILIGVEVAIILLANLVNKAARKLVQKVRRKEPAWPGRSQNFWR